MDTEAPSASDIYAICKGQPVPANLRPDVWQACLDVTDRGNQLIHFNEVFDLTEQNLIREDCQQLVSKYRFVNLLSEKTFTLIFKIALK